MVERGMADKDALSLVHPGGEDRSGLIARTLEALNATDGEVESVRVQTPGAWFLSNGILRPR